ncbi:Bromodomain [Macleaya cordata]|uniref:Bromodomain n=1 Tax=Macleaya cordata TaxID=56857 RepID=A0A200PWF8_MACCD|nr:Bromodomain [Macleaya cordata]
MALRKYLPSSEAPSLSVAPLNLPNNKVPEKAQFAEPETAGGPSVEADVDIDLREVYFLIMHFLSAGPCHRTYGQFWNELLEHQLLPRRYHAWYSRNGTRNGDENDNGLSFPLSYNKLVERYPHVEKDHLVKLLKQLILTTAPPSLGMLGGNVPNAADVPTLLGSGPFSLLGSDRRNEDNRVNRLPGYLRWPHMQADQVHGLALREIGGGFTKHHRAPSIRAACYAIAKPSTMVQKMENIKKLRGHRDAVYCAIFDRSGRYVITGSDDRLVKIWSMETGFCLASCRGHEGDITDLAVSSNNALVASSSNDFIIRVWRLPDGLPISVLRGHTGAVTAIAFSPRPTSIYNLLSSSDDGTCRIWDARYSQLSPRIYIPKPTDATAGKSNGPSSSTAPQSHQILCCAYNANGTVFVTGSSDTYARVWNACKFNSDDSEQPNHEMDVLSGHENDVNYVQFSGCAVASRLSTTDTSKEENIPKFKNSWFTHDYIVTCSRDGSAIIWIPKSRRSHSKVGRWARAYHLKVPPPPLPPQPPRGGPRQRFLPTPRGVNMIVWSLDNRFVLAAIMDCRICVWNAVDGSLVHSLTGHSESTYVLDVHPFNPRIAMSAGYDGKTIVWDIWEGTPIRIYETGRFKLVDGKFSPDGTSIVLSDDVGQIYILTTGQGESQKDAKYDQFFLGDYRPLIQDTHGNALDQETQLVPYRRNIQDLLCDSSMIPYPEPYQSMYQQRRLGALGIEWRPSSVKFAVGPADISGLQDYPMLPLVDLDRMIEPLPEFIDAMDWEPENEVQSEDNDSEYNVTDEYSSEGEQGGLSTSSSGDPECSAEDSDAEHSQKDGLRRSKRKKHKGEVELMTSSGRRVKRRNLDERDGTLPRSNRSRKSRTGRKAKRRKSSTSKSLRSQRVAARNCRHNVSLWTGASTDEEEDDGGSESDSLGSEPVLPDSNIESNESDRSIQNVQQRHSKGKAVVLDESEDVPKTLVLPESQGNTGRRRLVLKLPARDSKKPISLENTRLECENQMDLVGSSSKAPQETSGVNSNYLSSQDPRTFSGNVREVGESEKVEDHLDLSAGYKDDKIRWGEVKARTSKRFRSGDAMPMDAFPGSRANLDDYNTTGNSVNAHLEPRAYEALLPESEMENHGNKTDTEAYIRAGTSESLDVTRHKEFAPPECAYKSSLVEKSPADDNRLSKGGFLVSCNGNLVEESKNQSGPSECMDRDEPLEGVGAVAEDKMASKNGTDHSQEVKENTPRISTKFRIRSKTLWKDNDSSSKVNSIIAVEDVSGAGFSSEVPSRMEQSASGVRLENEGTSGRSLDNGDENDLGKSEASRLTILQDSNRMHSDSNKKMYSAVYRRSKTYKARSNSEGDGGLEESTSNASNYNHEPLMDFPEGATVGIHNTRSMKGTTLDLNSANSNFKVREGHRSYETSSRRAEKFVINTRGQLLNREWRSNPKMTVGLRSTRNRRGNHTDSDLSSLDKRKSHQMRKLSWLMLAEQEESCRYIPQQGDEVVYLRQGYEEYIQDRAENIGGRRSTELVAWRILKGNLRAVEFCKVVGLDYSTLPGSGDSCCKITLQFVDSPSSVLGKTFKLTLPELTNFPDFIVERTRYDAAINRNWTHRDKCQVWWRNEGGEGGNWWEGRIVSVKPKSLEFPDSPWERYSVRYKGDDPAGSQHEHSPWELHDLDAHWEHPHIDDHTRGRLLASFAKIEQPGSRYQESHGVLKLKQISQKSEFLNRFPVPLSLEVIQLRLENNYYRSLEAVVHDFNVMLSNVHSYFEKSGELAPKMKRLADWFNKTISSL